MRYLTADDPYDVRHEPDDSPDAVSPDDREPWRWECKGSPESRGGAA